MLIADEPTSQLDLGATIGVASLLRDLVDDGLTVLLVVHDLALAAASPTPPCRLRGPHRRHRGRRPRC